MSKPDPELVSSLNSSQQGSVMRLRLNYPLHLDVDEELTPYVVRLSEQTIYSTFIYSSDVPIIHWHYARSFK